MGQFLKQKLAHCLAVTPVTGPKIATINSWRTGTGTVSIGQGRGPEHFAQCGNFADLCLVQEPWRGMDSRPPESA